MEVVELSAGNFDSPAVVGQGTYSWTYPGGKAYFTVDDLQTAKLGSTDLKGRLPADGYTFQELFAGWKGMSSTPEEDQPMTWTVTFGDKEPVASGSLSTRTTNAPMPIVVDVSVPTSAKPLDEVPVFTLLEAGVPVFRIRLDTGKPAPLT